MNRAVMTAIFAVAIIARAAPSVSKPASPLRAEARGDVQSGAGTSADETAPQLARLQDLLIHAISLIGVKYQFGGSSAHSGFDCSGFVRHVFAESLAIDLPRNSYAMGKLGVPVETHDLHAGDLVFYNTLHRTFSHVGIYLGEGRFVHAPSRGKSVEIVDMSDSYWKRHFNGARRLVGDE